jgi:hypothetical protein
MSDWIDEVLYECRGFSEVMEYTFDDNFVKESNVESRMTVNKNHIRFNKYLAKLVPSKKVIFYISGDYLMFKIIGDSDFLLAKDIERVTIFRNEKCGVLIHTMSNKKYKLGLNDIEINNQVVKKISNTVYKCRIGVNDTDVESR